MRLAGSFALLLSAFTSTLAASGVTTDASLAANQTFDYIVVGCGLTGLTVAARLAEPSNSTILCIEAGADNRNDSRVYDIYRYKDAFNTELDWSWGADKGGLRGGKTLGGSSSINGATWTRGAVSQYDTWQTLLESSESSLGWNWSGMFSAMKRAESYNPPSADLKSKGANSGTANYGTAGPVQVTYPCVLLLHELIGSNVTIHSTAMYSGPRQKAFQQTVVKLTNMTTGDINGGQPNAVAFVPNSLNWKESDHRSSSAAAYLTPVIDRRKKYLVLTTHLVTKLLYSKTAVPVTVSGVQFKKADNSGSTFTAYARKEVILAAGAIQSPALLQLSGIGDPALLKSLGITTVVNLPTVGKNLQEQTMSQLGAKGKGAAETGKGPNDVIAYPNLKQLFGSKAANISNTISSSLSSWASSQAAYGLNANALKTIYQAQADTIINKNVPVLEIFYSTGHPADIGFLLWPLLPFSRGAVKIKTKDAFTKPSIKINFFSVDIDLQMQIAGAKLVRKILSTPPLSDLSGGETVPGSAVAGGNSATDSAWRDWIKAKWNTVSHPVATCAMMRRNLGGVVNGRLKVYDTTNLRVVDASVVPLQVSAHLSSTLYGVAEKAAMMIKADA